MKKLLPLLLKLNMILNMTFLLGCQFIQNGALPESQNSIELSQKSNRCQNCNNTTYSVGGTLSGLDTGKSVTIRNNNTNELTITVNGTFNFSTKLTNNSTYSVTIQTQPTGQNCSLINANGIINGANITSIGITCVILPPTPPPVVDKWHPGIYVKVEDWQLKSTTQMNTIFQELKDTPQMRGIKVVILWGRYETKDLTSGTITYNFTQIDDILNRLSTLNNKHLILSFAWREFKSSSGATDILPSDLRGGQMWSVDPDWSHMRYDNLWAYKMSNQIGKYGYNLKLWDTTLRTRIDAFFGALAAHIDKHPNFNHMSTTESAIGIPVTSFAIEGGSEAAQFDGQIAIIRMMKKHFKNSLVIPDLNFSREHVANVVPILELEGIGLGSSNSNLNDAITRTTPLDAPGVLTYYPKLSGKIPLAPEIQGDDYESTYGAGGIVDHPPYDYIYSRVRDDLKANYTVLQRNTPYWLGSTTTVPPTPSMLKFIQTYPTIINDTTGAGGLNSTRPSSVPTP